MARRYFISSDRKSGDEPRICGPDAHHLCHVMRVRPGDEITVFDGEGSDYRARITGVAPDEISLDLIEPLPVRRESPLSLTVAQGFLKDKKMDGLVRQLTELGVTRLVPFPAGRSVASPDERRMESRRRRWIKIAHEAVKQCGRSRPMDIEPAASFSEALDLAETADTKLIFWENTGQASPLKAFGEYAPGRIHLMIGPEGGFDRSEIDQALARRFSVVSLGPRILRAETAALAAATLIQFLFGDMNQKMVDNHQGVE